MNYITQLRDEREAQRREIEKMRERIQELREHLASPKFNAVATDGSRTDWIATADVNRWLTYIVAD